MRASLENILFKVSLSTAIDEGNLNDAYRVVLESALEGLRITRAGIWFLSENIEGLTCQFQIDKVRQGDYEGLQVLAKDFPNYFEAIKSERMVIADDARKSPITREFLHTYLKPLGITSMLDVPIRHHGQMIGIICCEHTGYRRKWKEDETHFVTSLADLIGRVINAHDQETLRKELSRVNDHLEELVEVRTKELNQAVEILKEAKDQLVESEKLAALGSLVAGVAHEVNTPLGISITAGSALQDQIQNLKLSHQKEDLTEANFKEFLEDSEQMSRLLMDNLNRASALIKNFKQTAADQVDDGEHSFFLKWHLDHLVSSLHPETKKIPVLPSLQFESQLKIRSFPSVWGQIFTNLIINSCRHAFENIPKAQIVIKAVKDEEGLLRVTYQDNGVGVKADQLKKIMEPFYTTRRGQGGTGLGLAIVHNLVHCRLHGQLEVKSELGKGLEFNITCPKSIWE